MILGFCTLLGVVGYVKYNIWKAEHPQTETWIFFIPKGKR